MPLYSSDLVENAVDDSGRFELDGMAIGRYLLLVFQKDKVLAMKPVEVLRSRRAIEITLGAE